MMEWATLSLCYSVHVEGFHYIDDITLSSNFYGFKNIRKIY